MKLLNSNNAKNTETHIQNDLTLTHNLKKNTKMLKDVLGTSQDIVVRKFSFGQPNKIALALLFLDGLII